MAVGRSHKNQRVNSTLTSPPFPATFSIVMTASGWRDHRRVGRSNVLRRSGRLGSDPSRPPICAPNGRLTSRQNFRALPTRNNLAPMRLLGCLLVGLVFAVACSSSNDAGTSPHPGADAASQCREIGQLYCAQFVGCVRVYCPDHLEQCGGDGADVTMGDCLTGFSKSLDCSRAVTVTSTYDRCVEQLRNATCEGFRLDAASLPDSCRGVVLYTAN